MAYIQCKNSAEAEKKVEIGGFVSDDFRIYDKIDFWDDACIIEMPAETVRYLLDLQGYLEMVNDEGHEMSFGQIVENAKGLEKAFKKAMSAIRFAPLKKLPCKGRL